MGVIKPHQRLNKQQIEQQANQLLLAMQGTPNAPKWPDVADRAANFLNLGIAWISIPSVDDGKIAARIYPTERLIEFNEDFEEVQRNQGFYQSTLAHEIGHWVLHVNHDEADGLIEQMELSLGREVATQTFLCRNVNEQRIYQQTNKTQLDWMEWQAQYFASCLLMPRDKLAEVSRGRDLTKFRHLEAMKDELGVTISNLKHRLRDLGWIRIVEGSHQIYPGLLPSAEQTQLP